MKKRNQRGLIMSLPLFLFTVVFVAGPLIYMVALSFATNNEGYGVTPEINALCTLMLIASIVILFVYSLVRKLSGRDVSEKKQEI